MLRALELAEEIVPRVVVQRVVEMAVAEPHSNGLRGQIWTMPMCECNQLTMLERNQHATRDAIRLACSRKFASHGVDETVESKRGILSRVACQKRVGRNVVLSTVRAISMQ